MSKREIMTAEEAEDRNLQIDQTIKPVEVFQGPRYTRLTLVVAIVPNEDRVVSLDRCLDSIPNDPQEAHPHE